MGEIELSNARSEVPPSSSVITSVRRKDYTILKKKNYYEEEFALNRVDNDEKEFKKCSVCHANIGKFIADCGCTLCKEHAKGLGGKGNEEEHTNDSGIKKKCPKCKKEVNKVQVKKMKCGICLEEKTKVAKFKCKCALSVCKGCYIRCRIHEEKCPACRAEL